MGMCCYWTRGTTWLSSATVCRLLGCAELRHQAGASTPVLSYDAKRGKVDAAWSDTDIAHYITKHGILVNQLVVARYPSIGCVPCTWAVAAGEDPRARRWTGLAKTECGIRR